MLGCSKVKSRSEPLRRVVEEYFFMSDM